MKKTAVILLLLCCAAFAAAQPSRVLSDDVSTLHVVANDDPTQLPVIGLRNEHVDIDFDILSHEYRRLTYRIEHCNAEWSEASDLFDSDYIEGFGDLTIEDYEKSLNTSVLYTHYHLRLPNREVRMRLSGNYRVSIVDEDEETVLAEACFMVVEPQAAAVRAKMTTRTDGDINGRHQQLELEIGYGSLNVVSPESELKTFVMQNRRRDNIRRLDEPNLRNPSSIGYTHKRSLLFDAGAECHKFEIINKNEASLGVDHFEYHEPYMHAVLYAHQRPNNYDYDENHNGAFVIRDRYGDDADTQAEYVFVHFTLQSEYLPYRVYVQGDMTQGALLPEFEMQYDEQYECYELGVLLKQGYYEFRYVAEDGRTALTEGDFYETRNEYAVMVYFRARGSRYDQLVGQTSLKM